jgi:dihydroxyacetone kinase
MGGSSGVLLSIFFTATADAASSGLPMVAALKEGLNRMQQIGGAQLGDRSMVDALKPALDALEGSHFAAAKAARKGAIHTSTIVKARVGRAAYVNAEHLQGHIDPGAEAVARLFEDLGV